MTGKGPNCLPEDIKLFSEKDLKGTFGDLIIPAYADNAVSGLVYSKTKAFSGATGLGYNCGSGGVSTNNTQRRWTFTAGSGYAYGGGASCGGDTCATGGASFVDKIYPMRGTDAVISSYYSAYGGVGNPIGKNVSGGYASYGGYAFADIPQNKGVGGRIILFSNLISIGKLSACGVDSLHNNGWYVASAGGSGGGSINIFSESNICKNISVSGGKGDSTLGCISGDGGAGTIVENKVELDCFRKQYILVEYKENILYHTHDGWKNL